MYGDIIEFLNPRIYFQCLFRTKLPNLIYGISNYVWYHMSANILSFLPTSEHHTMWSKLVDHSPPCPSINFFSLSWPCPSFHMVLSFFWLSFSLPSSFTIGHWARWATYLRSLVQLEGMRPWVYIHVASLALSCCQVVFHWTDQHTYQEQNLHWVARLCSLKPSI